MAGDGVKEQGDNAESMAWVLAAQGGDRAAFEKLIGLYYRRAQAVTTRLLGNRDDGLEAVQDGFMRAYTALPKLKKPERFYPWLMRIMVNRALNLRRGRARRYHLSLFTPWQRQQGQQGESITLAETLPSGEPGTVAQATGRELQEALTRAIDRLPEELRTALLLFSVERLPQKEIAEMVGATPQTVKWRVFEARRRLRQQLQHWLTESKSSRD